VVDQIKSAQADGSIVACSRLLLFSLADRARTAALLGLGGCLACCWAVDVRAALKTFSMSLPAAWLPEPGEIRAVRPGLTFAGPEPEFTHRMPRPASDLLWPEALPAERSPRRWQLISPATRSGPA